MYFHQYFSTHSGSAGNRSLSFARELVRQGHQVEMVCLKEPIKSNTGLTGNFIKGKRMGFVEGFKVIEFDLTYSNHQSLIKRAYIFFLYSFYSVIYAVRSNADIVFSTSTPLTTAIPGIVSRWLRGKIFIFEVRDLWPELPKAMGVIKNPLLCTALSILEFLSYHSSDLCIGLAPGICEGIKKKGISHKNIRFIPNLSDLSLFKNNLTDNGEKLLLNDLKIKNSNSGIFTAVFAGSHGIANGLEILLDTAKELKKANRNDIHIVFLGDGKLKSLLKKRAKSEDLNNCFFLDPIPKVKLASFLCKEVDAGLMILRNIPEFYNGTSPNKFFDYLASGLPVIINYPGWLTNLIKKNGNGISVEPQSPECLAKALIYLAENEEKCKKMGSKSRKLARDFDSDKLSKEFVYHVEKTFLSNKDRLS